MSCGELVGGKAGKMGWGQVSEDLECQPEVFLPLVFPSLNNCSTLTSGSRNCSRTGCSIEQSQPGPCVYGPCILVRGAIGKHVEGRKKKPVKIISALRSGHIKKLNQVNVTDSLRDNFSLSRQGKPKL